MFILFYFLKLIDFFLYYLIGLNNQPLCYYHPIVLFFFAGGAGVVVDAALFSFVLVDGIDRKACGKAGGSLAFDVANFSWAGATIDFVSGTFNLSSGTIALASGTIDFTGGTIALAGCTFALAGGTTALTGGTIALTCGTMTLTGGTMALTGGLEAQGSKSSLNMFLFYYHLSNHFYKTEIFQNLIIFFKNIGFSDLITKNTF